MREININIEGFNVNGICVGCLNYNRKMYYSNAVKECFKLIGAIDVPDGLSIQVCYECLATAERVLRFQRKIIKSFDVLIKYSRQNTFLNSPCDLTQHATQTLVQSPVEEFSYGCNVASEAEKIEVDISIVKDEDLDIKEDEYNLNSVEPLKDELITEEQFTEDFFSQDDVQAGLEHTSEDDIQLSKLKKKKEKRSKKTKKNRLKKTSGDQTTLESKNSRKLKNLPEHLVELYTMSEEEMWQVRAEDLESEEFSKTRYKCRDCIIEFNTEKLMNDHMSGKHRPKSDDCDQCDVCKAYILTRDKLSSHRALHLSCYRCTACGRRTTLKRLMRAHVRVHGAAREEHACATCGNTFTTKSKLSYHRSSCMQERPQCDCCGMVFASKMTLKYHLNLKTPKEAKPKENLYIPCKGCDKVFTSKKSYRAHVVIHDGQTYPCPICGKLFQWKRNLARHTRNHRERDAGATHECRECGKSFSSRDCYNNHMRLSKRHVPEDAYAHECRYCGKKFASKYCLVDHIDWDHLNKTKYHCKVCFKAFKTAKIMAAHVNNIHEGKRGAELEGEHLCEICGKSYKTVKRLKGHVWAMHTNRSTTKSFRCLLCPATFTWQTSIYKHVKMMHNQKRAKPGPRHALAKAPTHPPPYAAARPPLYGPGGDVKGVAYAVHGAQQPAGV